MVQCDLQSLPDHPKHIHIGMMDPPKHALRTPLIIAQHLQRTLCDTLDLTQVAPSLESVSRCTQNGNWEYHHSLRSAATQRQLNDECSDTSIPPPTRVPSGCYTDSEMPHLIDLSRMKQGKIRLRMTPRYSVWRCTRVVLAAEVEEESDLLTMHVFTISLSQMAKCTG